MHSFGAKPGDVVVGHLQHPPHNQHNAVKYQLPPETPESMWWFRGGPQYADPYHCRKEDFTSHSRDKLMKQLPYVKPHFDKW